MSTLQALSLVCFPCDTIPILSRPQLVVLRDMLGSTRRQVACDGF